jgi:hypothetical protein
LTASVLLAAVNFDQSTSWISSDGPGGLGVVKEGAVLIPAVLIQILILRTPKL